MWKWAFRTELAFGSPAIEYMMVLLASPLVQGNTVGYCISPANKVLILQLTPVQNAQVCDATIGQ